MNILGVAGHDWPPLAQPTKPDDRLTVGTSILLIGALSVLLWVGLLFASASLLLGG